MASRGCPIRLFHAVYGRTRRSPVRRRCLWLLTTRLPGEEPIGAPSRESVSCSQPAASHGRAFPTWIITAALVVTLSARFIRNPHKRWAGRGTGVLVIRVVLR